MVVEENNACQTWFSSSFRFIFKINDFTKKIFFLFCRKFSKQKFSTRFRQNFWLRYQIFKKPMLLIISGKMKISLLPLLTSAFPQHNHWLSSKKSFKLVENSPWGAICPFAICHVQILWNSSSVVEDPPWESSKRILPSVWKSFRGWESAVRILPSSYLVS